MSGYEILLKPSAVRDLDALRGYDAAAVADGIEEFLTHEPTKESRSRIKRLRRAQKTDYRLRIGDYRVFYTVDLGCSRVEVLRVLHKGQTTEFYEEV
jgi:mRNA-degrading endonuclease RelE of RelBE toxin-antitoxin system